MSELHVLSPVDTGPAAERRARLAERAERAGCGSVPVNNSMQELLALVCINKAGRTEDRVGASPSDDTTLVAQTQDVVIAGAISDMDKQEPTAKATFTPNDSLLENVLRTSGRVVSMKS